MRALDNRGLFPLGLIAFAIGLAAYKAAMLSQEMTGTFELLGGLFLLDISFLSLLGLLAAVGAISSLGWFRLLLKTLLFLLIVFYTVHTFVLLALDEHMSLFDLGRYLREWRLIPGFINATTIIALLVFLAAIFVNVRMSRRQVMVETLLMLALLATGIIVNARTPFPLQKYALLQTAGLTDQINGPTAASSYTADERSFYSAALPGPVEFVDEDPNIILLIVESLSSINSLRVSGERDLLGGFDRLSEEGILFRNFFANHAASEGGIISFLSGFPPLHYPGATPLMFDEFAAQPSVIQAYRQRGYFTEFLTNADLGFIGLNRYISGLNFDQARGRDEVPAMKAAPRFVQDAPSDRYLYEEVLARVPQLSDSGRPWLMAVATVSTHLPYTHPEGGEDAAAAVWDWSLQQLGEFYRSLVNQGFFDNGILLISGDHRQMRPLSRQEMTRYGDSAKARIPLLAIGKDMPADTIDERFFQQSDLLRLVNRIARPGAELSPYPLWVERYNRMYGKVDSINRFGVFADADGGMKEFPVRISGTGMSWIDSRPQFSRQIETAVHAQRSDHQLNRSGGIAGCQPDYQPFSASPGLLPGLQLARVAGDSINELFGPDGARFVTQTTNAIGTESAIPGSDTSVLWYRAYIEIEQAGLYWFRAAPDNRVCMGLNGQLILDQFVAGAGTQGSVELEAGLHEMDLRYLVTGQQTGPSLQWVTAGQLRWRWTEVPVGQFRLPAGVEGSE
jgi:hypothetical protein